MQRAVSLAEALRGWRRAKPFFVTTVDQALVALSNAMPVLGALVILTRSQAGTVILWIGVAFLCQAIARSVIGDPILAAFKVNHPATASSRIRDACADALALGLVFALVVGLVACAVLSVAPTAGSVGLAVAVVTPALLVHDAVRFSLLSQLRNITALKLDLAIFAGNCATLFLLHYLVSGPALLLGAWAGPYLVVAAFFLSRGGSPSLLSRLVRPRQTRLRQAAKGYLGFAIVGQAQSQLTSFLIAATLSASAVSGIRGVQQLVVQPAQNLAMAILAFLTPRWSNRDIFQPSSVHRTAIAIVLVGSAFVFPVAFVAESVLGSQPKFRDMADLVLPSAIQAILQITQICYQASIRAAGASSYLLPLSLVAAGGGIPAVWLGIMLADMQGAIWGQVATAAITLATAVFFHRRAISNESRSSFSSV